jgi:hypothetical protein
MSTSSIIISLQNCLQDHPNYDPAYKLWPMLETIIHNVNAIMLWGSMDQCINKMTFAAQGYAKKGSGIVHGINGKPQL